MMTTRTEPDTPIVIGSSATTTPPTTDTPNKSANMNAVVDAAISEVWYLKPIMFAGRRTRIITQNFNGSVSITYRTPAVPEHVTEYPTSVPQTMFIYSNL